MFIAFLRKKNGRNKNIEENQAKSSYTGKESVQDKLECSICMNRSINTCCVPFVVIVFCDKCVETTDICFICQQPIFMKQKLFFS